MIYMGCSGWSYPDWVGPFYPSSRADKLSFYSGRFNTVEINTTFYRNPAMKIYRHWMEKSPRDGFLFSLKMPGEITHRLLVTDAGEASDAAARFEDEYVGPMLGAGKLGAVLIQLPPYFRMEHMENLSMMLGNLSTGKVRYFVEPRHSSLYGSGEFMGRVRSMGAGTVEIDGPEHEMSRLPSRNGIMYVRLHGRNREMWGKSTENPSDRYNYRYTPIELKGIAEIIREKVSKYTDLFLYFNNHPSGNAPANAEEMKSYLGIPSSDPQKRLF